MKTLFHSPCAKICPILFSAIALTRFSSSLQASPIAGCTNAWDCPDLIDYPCPRPPGKGEGCAPCNGDKRGVGCPVWRVSDPQTTLWIHDEPLGYSPAYGPRVSFLLSYKQRDYGTGYDTNIFSAGKGWDFSWLSYVVPVSASAEVHFAGGGVRTLSSTTTYDYHSGKQWFWPQSPGDPFVLQARDGSRDTYGFFVTNSSGDIKAYLSERSDATGQSIHFEYAAYNPSAQVVRLLRVIDAEGRQTSLEYNAGSAFGTNLISAVVDPFGRTNRLRYDQEGYLTNIVDVAGISTAFQY